MGRPTARIPAPTDTSGQALGNTALLRVAGMPCDAWTAGAAPHLFDAVLRHTDTAERLAERGRVLADRLGEEAVPHPALRAAERGAVLALRRRLHSGLPPRPADHLLLRDSAAVPAPLTEAVHDLLRRTEAAEETLAGLRQAIADEQERLAVRAWRTASDSPFLRAFLDSAAPGLADDVRRRLAAGEAWSSRRLRKRAAYLWRAMGRAAAKTTPRGWAGQIAALPVTAGDGGGPLLLPAGAALGALAAVAVENVHLVRTRPAPTELRTAPATLLLTPAPLHFTEPPAAAPGGAPGQVRCYVVDPREPGRLRQIVLRRTRALEGVLAVLADGPRPLGDLEAALATTAAPPGGPPMASTEVLRGFLQHLLALGVLQICRAPRRHCADWIPAAAVTTGAPLPRTPADTPGAPDTGHWFLDSYRRPHPRTRVPGAAAARVRDGLRIAARIAALCAADSPPDPPAQRPEFAGLTEQPRPVGEFLAERLPAEHPRPAPRHPTGWAPAHDPAGPYARLLGRLDAAARSGADRVSVDDALLDELGAPAAESALPCWPVDCLLRPLAPHEGRGPVAVLETASAAGVLDARFADGLRALHGGYGNSDAYRDFLAAVERRTGVRFVDLLVPPLNERSANAVRRPVTTRWWTGDPDPTPYYGPLTRHARYLPLDRISLRREGRRIVAEADGRRIVPVYHATRSPAPPYDTLVRLLLAASHPAASYLLRLDTLDAALPDRPVLPRLTAGDDLVLAPATWRVDRARLWQPGDDPLTKVRTLALLRRTAGLPRHAFVRTAPGAKPVPVDLASLTALHLLERLCAQQAGAFLLVEEMLPAPDGLLLRDPVHGGAAVAAQVLLRLPHDLSAGRLAESAARTLAGHDRHDVPGPPARRSAGAAITR
ncbi:lantibiotic dehydratase [Streptomyces sp. SAT1]|uniref:lantibiotic dehydratase n=1 Tax=Streptomyces sp. SAT1 TaxID=1849967 RepID=UPI0007DD4239|nr:lantibiotic dehydratase [Streptomyces sp. SAT1]ANH94969.1 lantibiotic dehydratase [Streptomyces sp. SAT1]